MRKWASALVVVAALVSAETAPADTPAAVYSDFAEDGVLSCGHSQSALKGVLKDASLYQYGDPLTFSQLKLAVRRQLAGGCRRSGRTATESGSIGGGLASSRDTAEPDAAAGESPVRVKEKESKGEPLAATPHAGTANSGSSQEGGMVLLGASLLLLTLASGGWAARRAFSSSK